MTEATVTRVQLLQECPLAKRRTFNGVLCTITYDVAQGVVYITDLPGLAPMQALCYPLTSILSMEMSFEAAAPLTVEVERPKTKAGKAKSK